MGILEGKFLGGAQTRCFSGRGCWQGSQQLLPELAPFALCYLSLRISIPLFPGHLWFMAREAVYSLLGEEKLKTFVLKCPWLGQILV